MNFWIFLFEISDVITCVVATHRRNSSPLSSKSTYCLNSWFADDNLRHPALPVRPCPPAFSPLPAPFVGHFASPWHVFLCCLHEEESPVGCTAECARGNSILARFHSGGRVKNIRLERSEEDGHVLRRFLLNPRGTFSGEKKSEKTSARRSRAKFVFACR